MTKRSFDEAARYALIFPKRNSRRYVKIWHAVKRASNEVDDWCDQSVIHALIGLVSIAAVVFFGSVIALHDDGWSLIVHSVF